MGVALFDCFQVWEIMLPGQLGDAGLQSALYCIASEIVRSVILPVAKEESCFLDTNCSKRLEILPVHVFTAESTKPASSLLAWRDPSLVPGIKVRAIRRTSSREFANVFGSIGLCQQSWRRSIFSERDRPLLPEPL